MPYVPGCQHDVFVSYAHGDDRKWVERFTDRLEKSISQKLGFTVDVWIDSEDLRSSTDFQKEIPERLSASGALVLLPSPTYVRSNYCVQVECQQFAASIPQRRSRFKSSEFANELFAFRCPILPVDKNEHRSLIAGLSDIDFHDGDETFASGSPGFRKSFAELADQLTALLKRMRNNSTPVFLYPPRPTVEIESAHTMLTAELNTHRYRILPDRETNLEGQLQESELRVFLLGASYDETVEKLVMSAAKDLQKPSVIWCAAAAAGDPTQLSLIADLQAVSSAKVTYLDPATPVGKLKEEVLALLGPPPAGLSPASGKPRIYLLFDSRKKDDASSAGRISRHFRSEFHFEFPDNPAYHTRRLAASDGVLLVWGSADEEWSSEQLEGMLLSSGQTASKGLCLFDPRDAKNTFVSTVRSQFHNIHIAEQFGQLFDPGQMEPFFTPIRRRYQVPSA